MTYMPETDFSTAPIDVSPSTVEKLKTLTTESSQRSKRVISILRTAFTETVAEVKDGRAVIAPLAKEVTSEAVETVKDKGQQAADMFSQTWQQESEQKDFPERMIAFIRNLANVATVKLLPQFKTQVGKFDGVLSDRYGQEYENFKGRFDVIRSWTVTSEPTMTEIPMDEPGEPTVVIDVDSEVVR